jgi:hypothetical protein
MAGANYVNGKQVQPTVSSGPTRGPGQTQVAAPSTAMKGGSQGTGGPAPAGSGNPLDNRTETVETYHPNATGGAIDSTVIAPPGAPPSPWYDYGHDNPDPRWGDRNRTPQSNSGLINNVTVNSGRQADVYWDNYGGQASADLQREQDFYQQQINQQAANSQAAGQDIGMRQGQAGYDYGALSSAVGQQYGAQSAAVGQQLAQQQADIGTAYGAQASAFGQQQAMSLEGIGQRAVNAGLGQASALQGAGTAAATSGNFYGNQLRTMGNAQQQAGFDAQGREIANYNSGAGDQYGHQASLNAKALTGLEAQQGPSAAQAQLASATNRNQAQALAMARSGRGWGGSASALGQASVQAAQAGQEAGNQSAMLRAQEDASWRARQAQNLSAGAGIYQQGKNLEMSQQQQAAQVALQQAQINDQRQVQLQSLASQNVNAAGGMAQQGYGQQLAAQQAAAGAVQQGYGQQIGAQQAAANAALTGAATGGNLANQALAGASQSALGGLAQGSQSALAGVQGGGALVQQGLAGQSQSTLAGYGQSGQLYGQAQQGSLASEALQGQVEGAYQGYEQGYQNQLLQAYGIEAGLAVQQAQMSNQLLAAGIGAVGSMASVIPKSDRDEKENIQPTNSEMLLPGGTSSPTSAYDFTSATQNSPPMNDPHLRGAPDPYSQGVGAGGSGLSTAAAAPAWNADAATRNTQSAIARLDATRAPDPAVAFQQRIDGALARSDRDKKKNIKPANDEILIPADTLTPAAAYDYNASIIPAIEQAPPYQGAADPYAQGVGISGPGQMQTGAASNAAALGAGAAARGQVLGGPRPPSPAQAQPVNAFQGRIGLSDEREKEAIKAIEATPGYSYDYKDPDSMGAAPGRQFGVMAQDLEKTPAGRSTVRYQPDGTKMVDTSRLTMVNTAALNALEKRVEKIDKKRGRENAPDDREWLKEAQRRYAEAVREERRQPRARL